MDLFSGIGGFSLGLERTGGFRTVAFCEIEPFCRRVLAKHWPEVPCYDDVRTLTAERLRADGISVDVVCGGFPCQDISFAGKGAGLAGERSGLWSEYARLVGELRPSYVIVENVAALLGRGLGTVLGDLAALGFDAEWHCIPASAVGAPHRRDRVWIIAYRQGNAFGADADRLGSYRAPLHVVGGAELRDEQISDIKPLGGDVAHAYRKSEHAKPIHAEVGCASEPAEVANAQGIYRRPGLRERGTILNGSITTDSSWWFAEPSVGRVADGVPARMDRLRSLGNAVVPQVVELIGRAILAAEAQRQRAAA